MTRIVRKLKAGLEGLLLKRGTGERDRLGGWKDDRGGDRAEPVRRRGRKTRVKVVVW
jgi:hypothetical protein